jgi:hypothetical protein
MKKRSSIITVIAVLFLIYGAGLGGSLQAGEGFHSPEDRGKRERHRAYGKRGVKTVPNQTYKNTCGECHLAYPPKLLPASSWEKIVNRLDNHFGEQLSMDGRTKETLRRYLVDNGADRSSCKKSIRIMKSLQGKSPIRITEVPYIIEEHREIPLKKLQQKGIGSLSNCLACHKTADQGLFRKSDHSFQESQRPAIRRMG